MSLLNRFPHECTVQRRKTVKDPLGGSRETREIEQRNVPCWVQKMSSSEVQMYDKRGMKVTQNVFFLEDLQLTERHEIVITKDRGRVVPVSQQQILEIGTSVEPDASAGLGLLWKYVVNNRTGQ